MPVLYRIVGSYQPGSTGSRAITAPWNLICAGMVRTVVLCLLCLLGSCGTSERAPVQELGQPAQSAPSYIVQKGDTLFSIAWRFNLDYRKLAAANRIPPPYVIRPQDKILLTEVLPGKKTAPSKALPAKNTVDRASKPVGQKTAKNSGNPVEKGVENAKLVGEGSDSEAWIWPVTGEVIRLFSPQDQLSKGIDISARPGTPIVSSRSGEVVYAGSQLKGYGNLIIIRHDEEYLSAYAHNRVILVNEGQLVKQGEKIAELGSSGTQSPKLHFEIRQNGKPVNPLQFLTKK